MGKFGERNGELIMEAWPDEDERNAFFDKLDDYFTMEHSDEIYATMPNAKPLGDTDKELVWLVRKSHFAYPKDGSQKEFMDTFTEYTQNVFHKNDVIKAYYPMAHAWGSDKTEFVEAFAVESLGDFDEMFKRNNELFEAHWDTDEKKEAMNKKGSKYFTGVHGDFIYSSIPELRK